MTDFDFSDINLDFLQTTPPRNGAPTQENERMLTPYKIPELDLGSRPLAKNKMKSKRLSEWAKKIAKADELLIQIKKLENDKMELQTQLQDLQQSAVTIQNLYTNEKVASDQKSKDIKILQEQFEKVDADLTIKNLKCDQLEGQIALQKDRPVEYNELVIKYLKLLNRVDDESFPRNCSERVFNDNIRQYCAKYKFKIPPPNSPKQNKTKKQQPKEHVSIQCDLLKELHKQHIGTQCELLKDTPQATKKPAMKTQNTQCKPEMRNQGCQHISTMTTRGTTTACFIKYRSVGTNSPDQQQLIPIVDEILREFVPWQNIKPISPLIDQPITKGKSTQKCLKSIGTCTWLCNIRRPIDFIPNKKIQRLNNARSISSTSDCAQSQNIKEEIMTPSPSPTPNVQTNVTASQNAAPSTAPNPTNILNSNPIFAALQTSLPLRHLSEVSFDGLWHIFGRMLWGLLQTSNAGIASSQNSSVPNQDAVNQHHFNSWLRELYENSAPASHTAVAEEQISEGQTTHNIATSPINIQTSDVTEVIEGNNESTHISNVASSPLHFNNQSPPFGSPHIVRPQPRRSNRSEEFRINEEAEIENSSATSPVNTVSTKENLNLLKNSMKKHKKILDEIQELFPGAQLSKSKRKALKRLLKETKKRKTKKKIVYNSEDKSKNKLSKNEMEKETSIGFLNKIFDSTDEMSQKQKEIALSPAKSNELCNKDKDNFKIPKNVLPTSTMKQLKIHNNENNRNKLYSSLFGGDSDTEEDEEQDVDSLEENLNAINSENVNNFPSNTIELEETSNEHKFEENLCMEERNFNSLIPKSILTQPMPLLVSAESSIQKQDPPINLLLVNQMDVESQNRFDSTIDEQLSEFPIHQSENEIFLNCDLDKDLKLSFEGQEEVTNLKLGETFTVGVYNHNKSDETFQNLSTIGTKKIFENKLVLSDAGKANISLDIQTKKDVLKQLETELSLSNESSSTTLSDNRISVIEISSDITNEDATCSNTDNLLSKKVDNLEKGNQKEENMVMWEKGLSKTKSNLLNKTKEQSASQCIESENVISVSEDKKLSESFVTSDDDSSVINLTSKNTNVDDDECSNRSKTPNDELIIDTDTEEDHNEKSNTNTIENDLQESEMVKNTTEIDLQELEIYNINTSHEISNLLNSTECRDILSESILPLVNEVLRDEEVMIEKTPLMDKKPQRRGRKRKSECQPEEQLPCKRSERLRARNGARDFKVKEISISHQNFLKPPSPSFHAAVDKPVSIENHCNEYLESPLSTSPLSINQKPLENRLNSNSSFDPMNSEDFYNSPLSPSLSNQEPLKGHINSISSSSLETRNTNECFNSPLSPTPPENQEQIETLFNNTILEIPLELSPQYLTKNQSLSLVENLMHYYSPTHFKRIINASSNQKTETQTKRENLISKQYEKILYNYCNSNIQLDPDIMASKVLESLKQFNSIEYSLLCQEILKTAKTSELSTFKDSEMPSIIHEMPPRHCSQTLQRLYYLLKHLNVINPQFCMDIMLKIDNTLFNIQQTEKITLSCSVHLVQLYLMSCKLQEHRFQQHPGRFLIAKCLYFHTLKSIAMVNEVLMWYPTVLPPKEDRTYDRSDALITVIQQLLMNTKYDMENSDLRGRQLLSKLRFEYHYQPFKPSLDETIDNLMEKLKLGKFCNLSYAFALLCKRMAPARTINLLETQLMPLANDYFDKALTSPDFDEQIAQTLDIISKIAKPLPTDVNVDSYLNLFSRFLGNLNRPLIQEAAVCSIIRLQRFGYVNCFHRLMGFMPSFQLSDTTQAMLKTFIHRKPLSYLKAIAKQGQVNLS